MKTWITPEVIAMKREALESIYHHRMTVYHHENVFDESTGFYEPKEVPIYIDEPCRGSTQLVEPTMDRPKEFTKKLRIHCAPELDIPIGSHIILTFYHNKTQDFGEVSSSRHYSDHQVLLMNEFREDKAKYA